MSTIIILVGLAAMVAIAAYGWWEWYTEKYQKHITREEESRRRLMKEIRKY